MINRADQVSKCWKHGSCAPDADDAFRFLFSVDSIDAYEVATLRVVDGGVAYEPGYMQIYCEGAAPDFP